MAAFRFSITRNPFLVSVLLSMVKKYVYMQLQIRKCKCKCTCAYLGPVADYCGLQSSDVEVFNDGKSFFCVSITASCYKIHVHVNVNSRNVHVHVNSVSGW